MVTSRRIGGDVDLPYVLLLVLTGRFESSRATTFAILFKSFGTSCIPEVFEETCIFDMAPFYVR